MYVKWLTKFYGELFFLSSLLFPNHLHSHDNTLSSSLFEKVWEYFITFK